ncbi:hypothetical protein [Actinomyces faecalis]|uniref:hypothetical protein n=1 Tax=Actinomyces faecalis TaxID=2722820 RepID=UPI0015533A32|nr:hypothetical protein [Actinomyces faecalis]
MSMTKKQHDGGPAPLTPGGGVPVLPPRGRRRDHVTAGLVGLVLAPVTLVLTGVVGHMATQGRLALTAFHLLVLLLVLCACQALFAARSSLGGLVAGLVALTAQVTFLVLPGVSATAPSQWLRPLAATGTITVTAALLVGGSWGMRWARRGGREQARSSLRLTEADRALGVTPSAPPSRRRSHLLTLAVTTLVLVLALALLTRLPQTVLDGQDPVTPAAAAGLTGALLLLVVAGAGAGRSSLGTRTGGILLILISLPALALPAWPETPFHDLLQRLLAHTPDAMTLAATGVLLSTVGWGAHLARKQGRSEELALARTDATETSAA